METQTNIKKALFFSCMLGDDGRWYKWTDTESAPEPVSTGESSQSSLIKGVFG